jgi:NitT/TauT family transport system substrate-binding protein
MRSLRALAGTLLCATVLVVAGCGGSDNSSNGSKATLKVQVVPVADAIPLYLGVKKGFFRDENLDLKITTAQGGAEIIPLVVSGSVQVGFGNTPSLLIAAAKGLPLQIVAPGGSAPVNIGPGGRGDIAAIMTRKDSGIHTPADLEGKTIAVNTIKSVSDVLTSAALAQRGVDPSKVKYLEVPIPDMLAALDAKRIDAAYVVSPFKAVAESSGKYRSILFPVNETRKGQIDAAYFVDRKWADDNEDVLKRFLTALRKSMVYSGAHLAEARATLSDFTKIPKPLIPTIPIGDRPPNCPELAASTHFLAQAMVKYGALEKAPDVDHLVRPGFCD